AVFIPCFSDIYKHNEKYLQTTGGYQDNRRVPGTVWFKILHYKALHKSVCQKHTLFWLLVFVF
ncbi:MAG: hypothetical protein JW745_04495, partial [Sedimentisphaerales bacterium]|nr:hypothetical protein [Sedimentisphaerales bacterium]